MTTWPWAEHFTAETLYFNTATMGLPPTATQAVLQERLAEWSQGRADAAPFDAAVAQSRTAYGALVGVPESCVAVGSQASAMVAPIASWVPDGAEVLVATGEFTSLTFPFFAQAGRGVRVREVPLPELPDQVGPDTFLVAVAAVQSADGALADLPGLRAAAARHGTHLLLDITQAAGWLPMDLTDVAFTVCSGYKWLLAPRGTGYLTVRADLIEELVPHQAGWYAGEQRWSSLYGGPLRLAADARRFDVSPAWHSWAGAVPGLELLTRIGVPQLHAHATGLARRFCDGLGLEHNGSAIVACSIEDPDALTAAGVRFAYRAGNARFSYHLNNTIDQVDQLLDLISTSGGSRHGLG